MSSFDYNAPAELFLAKRAKGCRTKYRRFATAAEALRYAVEDLRTPKAFGAHLEVGDEPFNSGETFTKPMITRCGNTVSTKGARLSSRATHLATRTTYEKVFQRKRPTALAAGNFLFW